MALDAYQPCPTGIDKKIKFCCGADILDDLAKVEEALAGDQRLGALDLCNRLLEKKPDRPCLLLHKSMVQLALNEMGPSRETARRLLEVSPGNPGGMAISAILDCHEAKIEEAVDALQSALEGVEGKLLPVIYQAIGIVARTLEISGEPVAAQAHAVFQAAASQGQDRAAVMSLIELESSGQIPLAVQGMMTLVPAPAEGPLSASGIAAFNTALKRADLGCWRDAAKQFEALGQREPDEPAVWRNLAVCRMRVLDHDGAIAALRRYTALPAVAREDAVEAEAMAQYLSDPAEVDWTPEMTVTLAVTDAQALREQLASDKRVQMVPFDPAQFREGDEPPPLALFHLLDREVGSYSPNLSRDTVPKVVGDVLLYGKETDRPARVEMTVLKGTDYEQRISRLREVLGSFAGEKLSEEESGRVSAVAAALAINWRFPNDTPTDVRQRMVEEHRNQTLLSIWPNLPMGVLDGRTPRQAVVDPAGQIRVQALILRMDLAEPVERPEYNKLRRSLGLPTLEPIDPSGVNVEALSPARQARLDAARLTDEQLVNVFRGAVIRATPRLTRKVAMEIVSRPSLDQHAEIDKAEAYDILARMAADADEAVTFLKKAQEIAKAKGRSPARYMLQELPFRLQRGEADEARRLLELLTTRHANEPGVSQAVFSLLSQLGLIRVDPATGRPVMMVPSAAASPVGSAAAAAPTESGLWTPEQIAPAAEGKGKLWLPGME